MKWGVKIFKKKSKNQILFQYLRDKKKQRKKGAQKKRGGGGGGENSPISPPLDPRLIKIVLDFLASTLQNAIEIFVI